MIQLTQTKDVVSAQPQARINNAAVTCTAVDRKNFDYANVKLILGATDVGLTVCKLQESDDNVTFTDVTGADFSISGVLPASTDSNKVFEWDVDLKSRKRFLRPAITIGNGTLGAFVTVLAQLFRAEQSPATPSARGAAQVLAV